MSSTQGASNQAVDPQTEPSPQLTTNLPRTTTYLTGHNDEGQAIVYSARPASYKVFDGGDMGFNQIYTNLFPADLNGNADVKFHDEVIAGGNLGLATKGGIVCRMVDFSPGYKCLMHRTKSLDFGILVEGEVEMILGDGTVTPLRRGDIAVQRATLHAWRNPSTTNWSRMVFVLQDMKPLIINGKKLGEDYGTGTEGLLPSGNDDD
ncbi:hypothetical protein F4821DRAFT_246861 [Hypoxylon rubiginosum]|uniref:Uncharacterized protein n=1 Tax=Hypoxylon rubiginosum TaxID=110542 RepID=A0ACC0CQ61_9PEZI|nr:hypothetical protein F4821DRAFT_246861 [Hypoxylon rubiginosum]